MITIFWKQVLKHMVGEAEEKSEIAPILNQYKDTLDNLIDSSDTESPDHPDSSN